MKRQLSLPVSTIPDDKPVKVTLELPAALHRDLTAYTEVLAFRTGQPAMDPMKLIVPMLKRFITTDRGFARAKRSRIAHSDDKEGAVSE